MKKSTKWAAGTLGAAFATVAVVGLVPALNGSQPDAVWQQEAETAVRQATNNVSSFSEVTYSSSKEANSAGFYDSKILEFEVKTTIPFVNVTQTAEVRCDQEKSELGLRGGQITCSAPVFKNAQLNWNR